MRALATRTCSHGMAATAPGCARGRLRQGTKTEQVAAGCEAAAVRYPASRPVTNQLWLPCCRKLASQFMGVPGVVSFSGGFPPADLFPFESLGLTVRGPGGSQLSVTVNDPAKVSSCLPGTAHFVLQY